MHNGVGLYNIRYNIWLKILYNSLNICWKLFNIKKKKIQ